MDEMFLIANRLICISLTLGVLGVVPPSSSDPSDEDTTAECEVHCRPRERLVTDAKDDQYSIVEGALGEITQLQCHFCDEPDDNHPKSWYKMDPLDDQVRYEVRLGMKNHAADNRVHTTTEHTLVIRNLTCTDRGEYFCKGFEDDELANKLNFLLDDIPPEKGNLSHWRKYHNETLVPINKVLAGNGTDVQFLKNNFQICPELETSWGQASPCEVCGRPKGEGRRYTEGHCRIKLSRCPNTENIQPWQESQNASIKMLQRATHLSCRSITLYELIPEIINRTAYIPDYLLVERCEGVCSPDAKGVFKGWRSTKKGFKYKKTFVLAENAHLTLICPEATLENEVEWKINNQRIKPGESKIPRSNRIEPRVFVDSFNTLYLYEVTKEEEGNYTCYVDKVRMQQVRVFVVSKSRLLTQAFVRHMMYLAFVLSLTLSCYCAGLIVTWFRRDKFKSYGQIRHELKAAHKLDEDDASAITITDETPAMSSSAAEATEATERKRRTSMQALMASGGDYPTGERQKVAGAKNKQSEEERVAGLNDEEAQTVTLLSEEDEEFVGETTLSTAPLKRVSRASRRSFGEDEQKSLRRVIGRLFPVDETTAASVPLLSREEEMLETESSLSTTPLRRVSQASGRRSFGEDERRSLRRAIGRLLPEQEITEARLPLLSRERREEDVLETESSLSTPPLRRVNRTIRSFLSEDEARRFTSASGRLFPEDEITEPTVRTEGTEITERTERTSNDSSTYTGATGEYDSANMSTTPGRTEDCPRCGMHQHRHQQR